MHVLSDSVQRCADSLEVHFSAYLIAAPLAIILIALKLRAVTKEVLWFFFFGIFEEKYAFLSVAPSPHSSVKLSRFSLLRSFQLYNMRNGCVFPSPLEIREQLLSFDIELQTRGFLTGNLGNSVFLKHVAKNVAPVQFL